MHSLCTGVNNPSSAGRGHKAASAAPPRDRTFTICGQQKFSANSVKLSPFFGRYRPHAKTSLICFAIVEEINSALSVHGSLTP